MSDLKGKNVFKEYVKYVKYHHPVFYDLPGAIVFCYGTSCKIQDICNQEDITINSSDIKELAAIYPEWFV